MLDNVEYRNIKKLLEKNDLKKLDEYLEKLHHKYQLSVAREKVKKYFECNNPITAWYRGKILVSNMVSAFLLETPEVLSDYRRMKLKKNQPIGFKGYIESAGHSICVAGNREQLTVDRIEKNVSLDEATKVCFLCNDKEGIKQAFNIKLLEYAEAFLGNDVKYTLVSGKPACLATSEKGKGIILCIKIK